MDDDFDEKLVQQVRWDVFRVDGDGEQLSHASLPGATELLVFDIQGEKHALLTSQLTFYHVAQGSIHNVPFVVSFCCVCHSGAQLDPRVDGSVLDFQCEGLYQGTAILRDLQTGSLWHHLTGRAVHGSKAGAVLATTPLQVTTAAAALKDEPKMRLHRDRRETLTGRVLNVATRIFQSTGWLPPLFMRSMPKEDSRLPRMTLGLGVTIAGEAKFYEMCRLQAEPVRDTVGGDELTIAVGEIDRVPFAVDHNGHRPLQYFLRWYGFALTYPQCAIWRPA